MLGDDCKLPSFHYVRRTDSDSAHVMHSLRTLTFALLLAAASGVAQAQGLSPVARAQRFGGACHDCDLSNRALPGLRIEAGDFSGANFARAFLVRMNGAGSTFTRADFTLANLTGARLMDARCEGARFSGAQMARVDASRAQFADTDFANAELPDAIFVQARLSGASFAGAKAMRANFLRADLRGASLLYARLDGADFTQADVRNARFRGASLAGANLATARNLTAAQLRGACGDSQTRLPPGLSLPECAD
jgi:uncharacterized protein YjbI with pentapeptide repeats